MQLNLITNLWQLYFYQIQPNIGYLCFIKKIIIYWQTFSFYLTDKKYIYILHDEIQVYPTLLWLFMQLSLENNSFVTREAIEQIAK